MTEVALAPETSAGIDYVNAFSDSSSFESAFKVAKFLSTSELVPSSFRGKPADILIGMHHAARLGLGPLELLPNLSVIYGKANLSTSLVVSLWNTRRARKNIDWKIEGSGAELVVTAFSETKEGQHVSASCSMAMAQREGWVERNSKYKSMPEHMLKYRAATFLVRLHAPELLLGMSTGDEARDSAPTVSTSVQKFNAQSAEVSGDN